VDAKGGYESALLPNVTVTLAWWLGTVTGMGWVQRHRRHGALLALGALVLQIVLTLGHVHLNPHGLTGDSRVATSAQHQHMFAQRLPQRPEQNPGDDDDYCVICASIFLASTSFTPAPPMLPMPVGFQPVEYSFDYARSVAGPQRLAFRSRAPPAV
jgi:hypothetical protein